MKTTIQLTWEDYFKSMLLHISPPRWIAIILYTSIIGGIFVASPYLLFTGQLAPWYGVTEGIFVVLLVIFRFVVLPNQAKQIFAEHPEINQPFDVVINHSGIHITNAHGTTRYLWTQLVKRKENKEIYLLYHTNDSYLLLPKRLLTDERQLHTLKGSLEEYDVPVAKPGYVRSCLILLGFAFVVLVLFFLY